jgi:hypothetical protein
MRNKLKDILHKIAHITGWYHGIAWAFYDGDKLMMSFKCSTCKKLSGIHCVDRVIDRELKNEK